MATGRSGVRPVLGTQFVAVDFDKRTQYSNRDLAPGSSEVNVLGDRNQGNVQLTDVFRKRRIFFSPDKFPRSTPVAQLILHYLFGDTS